MSVYEEFNKSKIFIPFVKFDTDQILNNGVKIPSLYIFLSTGICTYTYFYPLNNLARI